MASLNRPGGNVTGISELYGARGTKRLELLRELAPCRRRPPQGRRKTQADLLKKVGPSGNEGLNFFIEGGRINGQMYRGTSEGPELPRICCNRFEGTSRQFKVD